MKNKRIFVLWLLVFSGCNSVVKQNIGLEEVYAALTAASRFADGITPAASAVASRIINAVAPFARAGANKCARGVAGAANTIANCADRVASAAGHIARSTED